MTLCYLALGSNLGDREAHLARARRAELEARGARILRESSVQETEPFGVLDQPLFLNQVLEVDWQRKPARAPRRAQGGPRRRSGGGRPTGGGPREIDVDILLFNGDLAVREEDLTIPHPGSPSGSSSGAPLRELRPDIPA